MTDLHLYPTNDAIDHETNNRACLCGPVACGELIIHQPLQPTIEGHQWQETPDA